MELSLRSVAKSSTVSGEPFSAGDRVASFLYRADSGEVERADLLESEVEGWSAPGPLLCRWRHTLKDRVDSEAEARRSALQSAEELFFALHEADLDAPPDEEPAVAESRRVLLNLLALMLERKRILKARGRRGGMYWHPATKRELRVPPVELKPEQLLGVQEQLAQLV